MLSAVSTQLLGVTHVFAHNNSIGDQSILETSQLDLKTQIQYPEWDSRAYYTVGDRVIYNGQIWEALVSFQGHGDLNWAPAINSTLWRLIGNVEPEQVPEIELDEVSSEGIEYMFHSDSAIITGFNGTQNNVLIPRWVMHAGRPLELRAIEPYAFANKGIKSLEIENTWMITNEGAFAGNPLESVYIHGLNDFFMYYLTLGMQGVTTEPLLYDGVYDGEVPI